jgi:hypothetical protein
LERQVRFAAGLLMLAGLSLSLVWPPAIGLSWFVAAGLVFAAVTDWCGIGPAGQNAMEQADAK